MAASWTYVTSWLPTSNVTGGTFAVGQSMPAGTILALTVHMGGNTASTLTDSQGNTWTAEASITSGGTPASSTQMFHTELTTALGAADTLALADKTSGSVAAHLYRFDDADTVGEYSGIGGGTASIVLNSMTTVAGAASLVGITSRSDMTLSPDANWTVDRIVPMAGGTNTRGSAVMTRLHPADETITPTASMSVGAGWSAARLTVLPAAAPAPPPGDYEIVRNVGGTVTVYELVRNTGTGAKRLEVLQSVLVGGLGVTTLGTSPLGA